MKWRGSVAIGFVSEMMENFSDDPRLGDERDDAQSPTTRTQKRVELEDPLNQTRPSATQCLLTGGARGRFVFKCVRSGRLGLRFGLRRRSSSSNDVSVVSVVKEQMSPRLGDLCDDFCQKLERVDLFELREELAGMVVSSFGRVEDMLGARAPFQSGQAHGGAKHVARDVFESFTLPRGDTNGIIDVEAASAPRHQELDALVAQ